MNTQRPSELLTQLALDAINLGMKCQASGDALIPFMITHGGEGAIIGLGTGDVEEATELARKAISELPDSTVAYVFAFDGYLTIDGARKDAPFVEAVERIKDDVFVFAQRCSPKKFLRSAKAVGNPALLTTAESRLKKAAEPQHEPDASQRRLYCPLWPTNDISTRNVIASGVQLTCSVNRSEHDDRESVRPMSGPEQAVVGPGGETQMSARLRTSPQPPRRADARISGCGKIPSSCAHRSRASFDS